jgi:hypothetical protein
MIGVAIVILLYVIPPLSPTYIVTPPPTSHLQLRPHEHRLHRMPLPRRHGGVQSSGARRRQVCNSPACCPVTCSFVITFTNAPLQRCCRGGGCHNHTPHCGHQVFVPQRHSTCRQRVRDTASFSTFGSCNGSILTGARVIFASARDGQLPSENMLIADTIASAHHCCSVVLAFRKRASENKSPSQRPAPPGFFSLSITPY